MKARPDTLESIPSIGPALARKLRMIGVNGVRDLKGADPGKLYQKLERRLGAHVDRCVLYTFRTAVYYASHSRHDPEKLKWWNWKDTKTPNQAL